MFKRIRETTDECPICEKKRNLVYGTRTEVVIIRGEEIPVNVNAYHCSKGDHYFYDVKDEEDKYQTAYREFRRRKGLLQPEDIRQLREKYGLSQRAFARLLGCSSITIQRYESGALQDDVHNNLMLVLSDPYSFRQYFKSKRASLPDKISRTVGERLQAIEEEEKQLEIDFIFKQPSIESVEVDLSLLTDKGANREPFGNILGVFSKHGKTKSLTGPDRILKMASLSPKQPGKKWDVKNGNFSITEKGDLALAA